MSKYEIPDDHEWADEKQQQEPSKLTRVRSHDIEVYHDTEPDPKDNYERERYTLTVSYDDETGDPYVLYAVEHRWKGNYWRDITDWDWRDLPDAVRESVTTALPVESPAELDSGVRLMDEGGESRWEKHHKHRVKSMDAGEMWGSSFLGDALDNAETAAEAVRERDGDAEPVEQAVEEIQRAITALNQRGEDDA